MRYFVHFDVHFEEEAKTEDEAIEMAMGELKEDPTDGNWFVEKAEEAEKEMGIKPKFPNPDAITDIRKGWWFPK